MCVFTFPPAFHMKLVLVMLVVDIRNVHFLYLKLKHTCPHLPLDTLIKVRFAQSAESRKVKKNRQS